jgi:hypothetical protein
VLNNFLQCDLTTLFFVPYALFCIVDGTSFMGKDGNDISVQKLDRSLHHWIKKLTGVPGTESEALMGRFWLLWAGARGQKRFVGRGQ